MIANKRFVQQSMQILKDRQNEMIAYRVPKGKAKIPATVATFASIKKGKVKSNKSATANPRDSAKSTAIDPTATRPSTATTAVAAISSTMKCWNCGGYWTSRTRMHRASKDILLSMWQARIYGANLSDMRGKRGSEPVERVPMTPDPNNETRNINSYVTFESSELPSLRYFHIKIYGYPLAALVDSGSNRTLLGREGIKIIRTLGLATMSDRGTQIRTANGQIAAIKEEIKIPIELQNQNHDITIVLLPSLAVPCILGIDFLAKFGIGLDFASDKWYFANTPHIRYRLVAEPIPGGVSCCRLSELTPEQENRLKEFLNTIPKSSGNPGITGLIEHH